MPTTQPSHTPSVRSKSTNIFPTILRPCAEGADLRELWELASLSHASSEDAELLRYEENLLHCRDALIGYLEGCARCVQSRFLRNRFAVVAQGILATAGRSGRPILNKLFAGDLAEREMT